MRTQDDETSVLIELVEVIQDEPSLVIWGSLFAVLGACIFLAATVWAISRAGRFQPPRVVLSVILGLTALVSILGAVLQPESQALGAVAATAVGGLAAALGTAYTGQGEPDDVAVGILDSGGRVVLDRAVADRASVEDSEGGPG